MAYSFFSEPKNFSRHHTIDLPQRATEALRSHRKRQAEDYLNTGDKAVAGTLIFVALVAISIQAVVYLLGP